MPILSKCSCCGTTDDVLDGTCLPCFKDPFANPLNPFSDRYEHCATWSCDCGASGEGDPCDCPTCGCESRTVDGPLPGDDEPECGLCRGTQLAANAPSIWIEAHGTAKNYVGAL